MQVVSPTLATLLGLSLLGTSAFGQGYAATQGEILAAWGDDAPGLPGVKISGTTAVENAVVDTDGNVLLRAELFGTGITSLNNKAYFVGTSRDDLTLLIQAGDPAPGLPGLVLSSTTAAGISSAYRISPNGLSMWSSRLDGAGVTSSNDTAIFVGTGSGLDVLMREGDPAPGTVGATYSSSFTSFSQQYSGYSAGGHVLFRSSLAGGDVVSGVNDEAWFTGMPGAVQILQREGDPVLGTETIDALGFVSQMNAAGAVLHDAKLVTSGGGTATLADDNTLWIYVPGFGETLLVREGDSAPGTVGATFGNSFETWGVSVGPNAYNASGFFMLNTDLIGGDAIAGTNDRAMYLGSLGGLTLVARRGDPAPGTDATWASWNNSNTSLNNFGTIATQGNLEGGTSTDDTNSGIWINRTGAFELIAREGDQPPGLVGFQFLSFSGKTLFLNDRDQLVMYVDVRDVPNDLVFSSLWTWDPVTGLRLALLEGDSVEVSPGVVNKVTNWATVQFNNTDAAPLSFSHDGKLALRLFLDSGTEAVMTVDVGNFTENPKAVSFAAGGTQEMYLDAGDAKAGALYFVAGSVSGSTPGFPFGPFTIPLNIDFYFNYTVANPGSAPLGNTFGPLDANGRATATWTMPVGGIPGTLGLTATHAYVVLSGGTLAFVSEPTTLMILP